jgi:hypothetical protein
MRNQIEGLSQMNRYLFVHIRCKPDTPCRAVGVIASRETYGAQ